MSTNDPIVIVSAARTVSSIAPARDGPGRF